MANKKELFEYNWKGGLRNGRKIKGEMEGWSEGQVTSILLKRGILDVSVKKKPRAIELSKQKVTEKEIAILFRQLSTLIDAGVPIHDAVSMAKTGLENKTLRDVLTTVGEELEEGRQFWQALGSHPKIFDKLTCSLVEAGEAGGILDIILLRICTYKEKSVALKAKIKSAMIYPSSILGAAFIVTAVLMIFVIPVFAEMFSGFGKELPIPTQFVMDLSDIFVEYWYIVIGAPPLLIFMIKKFYATERGRYTLDNILLNTPIIGDVLKKASVAKFSRTFATLSAAGVPILEAIGTVAETSGNAVIEEAINESKEYLKEGSSLGIPLENSQLFPSMVTQMIAIGEQTGALDDMLSKIADFYEEEVDVAVGNMTELMEPLIMVVLGVLIGGLIISMYLPIFSLASGI